VSTQIRITTLLAEKVGDMMGMNLEIHSESELLHVHAMGRFSLEEAKRTFLEILEAVAQHKVKKVLFDGRRLTGEPEAMERFYYASSWQTP
jgi:hypothetical protein